MSRQPAAVDVVPVSRRVLLPLERPFRLDLTSWALRRRPHNAVDRWDGATYERVVLIDDQPVALSVEQHDASELSMTLTAGRIDDCIEAGARTTVQRLLGLSTDLSAFDRMAAQDAELGPIAAHLRGLRPPRFPSVFEALVNAIACQQLTIDVGLHLLNRLVADHGRPLGDASSTSRAFPDPDDIAPLTPDHLRQYGFSFSKARTVIDAARAALSGDLEPGDLAELDDAEVVARLTQLRGVGRWTAEYVLLRGLGRTHIFPGDDVGAHNKLRQLFAFEREIGYDDVRRLVARWHPFAGVVYFHLLLDALSRSGQLDREPQWTSD